MAAQSISLKLKKVPKKPKLTASKPVFDRYEKKKKEVDAHNKRVEGEKKRRKAILAR